MSLINNNMNVSGTSTSLGCLSQKLSKKSQCNAVELKSAEIDISQGVNNGSVVDADREVILDIESYKEELTESLEALRTTLSDLDRGLAEMAAKTIQKKQEDPENIAAHEEEDILSEFFEQRLKEMVLDVESFKEELGKSLEALSATLSDLDRAISNKSMKKIQKHQEDPENIATQKQEDPLVQFFKELLKELNQYGGQILTDIQGDVSAERVLPLIKD